MCALRVIALWSSLLTPLCAALGAEHVVIRSNAPAYEAGRLIDVQAPIALAAGQFLEIATEDGRLLRIEGPRNAPLAGDAAAEPAAYEAVLGALARLFGGSAAELGGLAGVRGGGGDDAAVDTRPVPWLIHSAHTGDQCFVANRPLELWREPGAGAATSELSDPARDASTSLAWPADGQRIPWPAALPPEDGRVFLVRSGEEMRSAAIRLHALPAGIDSASLASVAWLAAKGCTVQARRLLQQLNTATGD